MKRFFLLSIVVFFVIFTTNSCTTERKVQRWIKNNPSAIVSTDTIIEVMEVRETVVVPIPGDTIVKEVYVEAIPPEGQQPVVITDESGTSLELVRRRTAEGGTAIRFKVIRQADTILHEVIRMDTVLIAETYEIDSTFFNLRIKALEKNIRKKEQAIVKLQDKAEKQKRKKWNRWLWIGGIALLLVLFIIRQIRDFAKKTFER